MHNPAEKPTVRPAGANFPVEGQKTPSKWTAAKSITRCPLSSKQWSCEEERIDCEEGREAGTLWAQLQRHCRNGWVCKGRNRRWERSEDGRVEVVSPHVTRKTPAARASSLTCHGLHPSEPQHCWQRLYPLPSSTWAPPSLLSWALWLFYPSLHSLSFGTWCLDQPGPGLQSSSPCYKLQAPQSGAAPPVMERPHSSSRAPWPWEPAPSQALLSLVLPQPCREASQEPGCSQRTWCLKGIKSFNPCSHFNPWPPEPHWRIWKLAEIPEYHKDHCTSLNKPPFFSSLPFCGDLCSERHSCS